MKQSTPSIPAPSKNSRPIKFRGKSTFNGEWVYGWPRRRDGIEHFIIEEASGLGHDILNETLGQFTGLLDNNGKEIYEGDIVKYFWDKEEKDFHDNPVVVEWDTKIGGWILKDAKDDWFDGLLYENPTYKVIGNIFMKTRNY